MFVIKLKQVSFQLFLKVSVFVRPWRLDGREFQAFGPACEKLRSLNWSFGYGISYLKLLVERSLSRPSRSAVAAIIFQKASQAPLFPWCLPWLHFTNYQNRRYHAVHLTRSSPAPTISSLSHIARVLLHTGAWASAALLTYLLCQPGRQDCDLCAPGAWTRTMYA